MTKLLEKDAKFK
jgi:hypothetical protein